MPADREQLVDTLREMILAIMLTRDLDLDGAAALAVQIIDRATIAADTMLAR